MKGSIPNLDEGSQELVGTFVGKKSFTKVLTNYIYHKVIGRHVDEGQNCISVVIPKAYVLVALCN